MRRIFFLTYLHAMQNLLLLHGAIGAADQLQPLCDALSGNYKVHTIDLSGHGGRAFPEAAFSIPLFATEVLQLMENEGLEDMSIFGYSMGGYVAMYLARHYPERIQKVVTLATKFHWDEDIAAKEVQMLNAEKIMEKLPAFATTLKERHAPNDWRIVLSKTAELLASLGRENTLKVEDYKAIQVPSLLLLGDRDRMVSLEETVTVYKALPNAQMTVLPGTPHPIEQVDTELLAYFIKRFI